MNSRRILIAIDRSAVAAHVADVCIELARSLGAEVAFIHAIEPSQIIAPEGGVSSEALEARSKLDAARLMAVARARVPKDMSALEFIPLGNPGEASVRAAKEWPAI